MPLGRPASAPSLSPKRTRFDTQAAQGANLVSLVKSTAPKLKGTRQTVIKSWKFQVQRNVELLAHPDIPEEILHDHAFLLKMARLNVNAVAFLPGRWKLDRDFIFEVLSDNPGGWKVFKIGPAEHCNDRGLLLAAVKGPGQGWRTMNYASEEVKNDVEFMVDVTSACGAAVEYAPAAVKSEDAVVLASITAHAAQIAQLKANAPNPAEALWLKDILRPTHDDGRTPSKGFLHSHDVDSPSSSPSSPSRKKLDEPQEDDLKEASVGSEDDGPLGLQDEFVKVSRSANMVRHLTASKRFSELQPDLIREFSDKNSAVLVSKGGDVVRVVQLVVLDLKLQNGTGLVLMGHRKANGRIVDKCVYPGHKFSEGESPKDAMTKLLNKDLRPLRAGIVLKPGHKTTTKTGYSARYKCKTTYYTACFSATMDPSFDWMSVMNPLHVDAVDIRPRLRSRPHENFCRRFSVEGAHARPDMFELRYGDPEKYWPPITCEWPPKQTDIFAWVPPWEFNWLTTSYQGEASLKSWMSHLSFGDRRKSASDLRKSVRFQ